MFTITTHLNLDEPYFKGLIATCGQWLPHSTAQLYLPLAAINMTFYYWNGEKLEERKNCGGRGQEFSSDPLRFMIHIRQTYDTYIHKEWKSFVEYFQQLISIQLDKYDLCKQFLLLSVWFINVLVFSENQILVWHAFDF